MTGLRTALARRRSRWESRCRQCGMCCYEKERRGRSVITNIRKPCRYLDVSSRRCTVYATRFQKCAECRRMTVLHAMFVKWLPPQCGYVQHYRPWAAGSARPRQTA